MKVPNALDDIFRSVDSDGSGRIDVVEFVAATIDESLYKQRGVCWAAFRVFDLDGDGKVTHAELTQVLAGPNMQNMLGASAITQIISEFDSNGDGCIDFEEFYSMMASTSHAKDQKARDDAGTVATKTVADPEIEAKDSAFSRTKRQALAAVDLDGKKAKIGPD